MYSYSEIGPLMSLPFTNSALGSVVPALCFNGAAGPDVPLAHTCIVNYSMALLGHIQLLP